MDWLHLPVGVPWVIVIELEDCADPSGDRSDPNGGVTISLTRGPTHTPVITDQAMTRLRQGVYRYLHDPGESDPTGVYHAVIKTTHGGTVRAHPFTGIVTLG